MRPARIPPTTQAMVDARKGRKVWRRVLGRRKAVKR